MSDTTKAADKKVPPPALKKAEPVEVTFESQARGKRVYGKDGRQIAKFTDGKFVTSNEDVVGVLDGLSDVRRADD